jgi:hypothetical protein
VYLVDVTVSRHHPRGFDPIDPADLFLESGYIHSDLSVYLPRGD